MRPKAGALQRSNQLKNKDLIVSLFVHDIKAPLAVIDVGARSLLGYTDRHVSLSSEQKDLLREIIEIRNRAVSVLNRILGEGRSATTDRSIVYSSSLGRSFQALTNWVKRFLKTPDGMQQSASTASALCCLALRRASSCSSC